MTISQSDLLALADRVEALGGPDEALNGDIHWALQREHLGPDYEAALRFAARGKDYTASLDAALLLVADNDITQVLNDAMEALAVTGWQKGAYRQRLILFVLAAALRARAAMVQS